MKSIALISLTIILLAFTCFESFETTESEPFDSTEEEEEPNNNKIVVTKKEKPMTFKELTDEERDNYEPEMPFADAVDFLILNYKNAVLYEETFKDLEEYEAYLDVMKKANKEGLAAVDKIEKLSDRLEVFMIEIKNGKMKSSDEYKEVLLQIDSEKKRADAMLDTFAMNITSTREHNSEFLRILAGLIEDVADDFTEFGGERQNKAVERVETGAAVSLLDGSIKGFASGHQIDINLEVLEGLRDLFRQLQQKVDKLNEIPDEDLETSEEWKNRAKIIEEYTMQIIPDYTSKHKTEFGKYLPSIGAVTVRIVRNKLVAESIAELWEQQKTLSEDVLKRITSAEERYSKVVLETAVLLKSVIKDEL